MQLHHLHAQLQQRPSPRLDLGQGPDLESPQPAGCKGKIDFLFVISSGAFDTRPLLTHTFGLSRATEAIEFVATGEGLKVAVVPD